MENIRQNQNYIKKHSINIFTEGIQTQTNGINQSRFTTQFKISRRYDTTNFQLFPRLTQFGLSLEESNWKTAQSESITVNILNKNYTNTFNIKKGNLLLYLLLPYTNKKIITEYEYNESFDQS